MSNYPDDINSYNNDPRSPQYQGEEYQELASQLGQQIIDGDGEDYEDMLNSVNLYDLFEQLQELHSGRVTDAGALLGVLDGIVDSHIDNYLEKDYE
jgi:hypothetical protein